MWSSSILFLVCAVISCVVVNVRVDACSGSSSKPKTFHYDTSAAGLPKLLGAKVKKAERYTRPLADSATTHIAHILGLKHSGVVVTLENGQRFLVQKGNEYGRSSQTVVVNSSHMSGRWTRTQTKTIRNSRVTDYVRTGGRYYSLLTDNCHHASARMMRLN